MKLMDKGYLNVYFSYYAHTDEDDILCLMNKYLFSSGSLI